MTEKLKTLQNLLDFLKIPHGFFWGTEQNLMDLTNLFPFTPIIFTEDIGQVNQTSFFEDEELKILFTSQPELIKKCVNLKNKIFLSTKYHSKFTKLTREVLINIYKNHWNLSIPCDLTSQIHENFEGVYSMLWKIKLNNGVYNPQHTPVIMQKEHPITFLISKMHTIPNSSKKNQMLKLLAKILHQDFLVTGNMTLTSYFKLVEQMLNK